MATTNQLMRIIARRVPLASGQHTPEHALVLAIIRGGIDDLSIREHRDDAKAFFKQESGTFAYYCDLIGLCPFEIAALLYEYGKLEECHLDRPERSMLPIRTLER